MKEVNTLKNTRDNLLHHIFGVWTPPCLVQFLHLGVWKLNIVQVIHLTQLQIFCRENGDCIERGALYSSICTTAAGKVIIYHRTLI